MGPQFERLVPLEHEDGFGIEPGREHRRYLATAEFQARPEPLHINPVVPEGVVGKAEKQFAVHLGEAPQFESTEKVVGVVDRAVVGSDDVAGPNRMVVAVDALIPSGPPPGMSEQDRDAIIDAGQYLL